VHPPFLTTPSLYGLRAPPCGAEGEMRGALTLPAVPGKRRLHCASANALEGR